MSSTSTGKVDVELAQGVKLQIISLLVGNRVIKLKEYKVIGLTSIKTAKILDLEVTFGSR
jgi:hypothetical protein